MPRFHVVAGGVLTSLLLVIVVSELGDFLYSRQPLPVPAYSWTEAGSDRDGSAGDRQAVSELAAVEAQAGVTELLLRSADAMAGMRYARRCASCHDFSEAATLKVGPPLHGVVNRVLGSVAGYRYSQAIAQAGAAGERWDIAALDRYLASPKKAIPGTKMSFVGVRKVSDRANLIAYLQSLSQP